MPIEGVLETCLYAHDLDAAERFYAGVLELPVLSRDEGRHVFFRCGAAMLLVFDPERTTAAPGQVGGTPVPAHGASGAGHVCFRMAADDLPRWREHFARASVPIEATIEWPRGGSSLYVRDPAGNSVELAPASIWSIRD
ncbi:MAG: VOC family protein [Gemmatimonadaceae bacterium]